MTNQEKYKIISNDYVDLIIQYNSNEAALERFQGETIHIINENYAVVYYPASLTAVDSIRGIGYASIPRCAGLEQNFRSRSPGISRIREMPIFNLRGEGILIGIVDTGIDYTNPVFLRKDGTSKIVSIWDQTIDSEDRYPDGTYYGTEYSGEEINLALKSADPFAIVPSIDELGHGTMLAGIAAGSEDEANNFTGVVPDAELAIVKLKEAKQVIRNLHALPSDVPCYQENDIIWGIEYLLNTARRFRMPLVICIGMGTSSGAHDGTSILGSILSSVGSYPEVAIAILAGDEGARRRHFFRTISPNDGPVTIELNVGENENDFSMEIWGEAPDTYSIDITSPGGEYIPRIPESLRSDREVSFLFEATRIIINYRMVEILSGEPFILLRFHNPTPGIWTFQVYARGDLMGSFHSWLPSDNFITGGTYFIQSNPYTTITGPGTAYLPITVTAYNQTTGALYRNASKGFNRDGVIKPDLAAPGVNILCPSPGHEFVETDGTAAAAANMAGIAAMLMEWGIVRGHYPSMSTKEVKKFLIRGARRNPNLQYPNRDWGYGIADISNTFSFISGVI